jgi:D-alanine-D-alanine ligase
MKKKIAIAAGGDSGEYKISIQSAAIVEEYLDKELFEPFVVVIKGSEWRYKAPDGKTHDINKDDFSLELGEKTIHFEAVFIAIHGTPGEDGKLQGYFEMLKIPYTSSDQTTSTITFNKFVCNQLVSSYGYDTAHSIVLFQGWDQQYKDILKLTGLPCFVKPNSGGSSVGMSKVLKEEDLPLAINKAFKECDEVLVEEFIEGREITCGVFNDNGTVRSLPVTEVVTQNEFFDYEAKYTEGLAREITPAPISDELEKKCRDISEQLYNALKCRGVVRFDYIFNDSGIYFLEVNTVPGLSPKSIVPKQSLEEGIPLKDLFTMILNQALTN